jgi:hypothetical protein
VFAAPEYRWNEPRGWWEVISGWFRGILSGLDGLRDTHPLAYALIIVALIAVLLAVLTHLAYVMWKVLGPKPAAPELARHAAIPRRDAGYYRREAERLAAHGAFADALACRFRALVLMLDGRQLLRFHPARTPAEYLGDVTADARARETLADLVSTLYRHLFGGVACTHGDVARFDAVATQLEADAGSN